MNPSESSSLLELLSNCLRQDRWRLERAIQQALRHRSGNAHPDSRIARLTALAQESIQLRHRRHENVPQVSYPSNLPITSRKDEIVEAIRRNPVVVIAGETGSGKTTQIPKMCLEAGLGVEGKIGCTQPRRVAALSISRRIAEELKLTWGKEVGAKIRFTDRSSPLTYIKVMTDGILLAETQGDPDLQEYDALVIDEAHERSLNIDFLLGHLQLLLRRRPDLKVIITSATIDTEAFSKAFNNAPIIEVSGRMYPVDIRYEPVDVAAEERGDITYIDQAVSAAEQLLLETNSGDILIFMPSERDIHETQDDLEGRFSGEAEIVPLYGRLTSDEQERVFAPNPKRKVIVATNIAETSLTIPGVRYVIDTGLARMSRYSPRSRTKRLPIEPVSQSSAQQRAGRAGRIENGVCIRLYSEEDFAERPKFTQPEIQRANLAEVILKMKAWRLGEMETFPFINPPQPVAITGGYQLLQELGALDENRNLTPLGRDLARLPVDPSIGRMILESEIEGALDEVLIVAAGLSIQDPRERPLDKQEAADQAHRQFIDPHSDFLTLLQIWSAYDARLEAFKTQNQMRRFCRANFLSYVRMREWIDVHSQLDEALKARRAQSQPVRRQSTPAPDPQSRQRCTPRADSRSKREAQPGVPINGHPKYESIHRSILAGLLGHVAHRVERNIYKTSGNRQFMVWPGSALFLRDGSPSKSPRGKEPQEQEQSKARQSEWIMAGEILETSRLYGRTVAGVAPDWIIELGAHLCKRSYGEPFWEERLGRVLSLERVTLFGLEVIERNVDYGRIDVKAATEVFIQRALIEESIEGHYQFLNHNRELRQRIEMLRTRVRDHRFPSVDDALFEFYSARLNQVSSVHDLNRVLRQHATEKDFLYAAETDLTGGSTVPWDTQAFPNEVLLAEHKAALQYAYAPGEEHDGVTVKLPIALAQRLDPEALDWLVPGLRGDQIEFLLKSLPKSLRVPLMPIAPKVQELARELKPESGLEGLRQLIHTRYGVQIPADAWKRESLPAHLRPRIAITGKGEKVVAAGRELQSLQRGLEQHQTSAELDAWNKAVQQWERYDLKNWTIGDLPEQIEITQVAGTTLFAYPGILKETEFVHLKLFRNRTEAEAATQLGFIKLVEIVLERELAWAQKDLRALVKDPLLYGDLQTGDELLSDAYENLRRSAITTPAPLLPLEKAKFDTTVRTAKERIPTTIPKMVDLALTILKSRQEVLRHRALAAPAPAPSAGKLTDLRQLGAPRLPAATPSRFSYLRTELDRLVPKGFLKSIVLARLSRWPRYLRALQIRMDRALLNPAKDLERAKLVQPYLNELQTLASRPNLPPQTREALEEFRALVEEYKVSVFAQELGTAQPVSPKRLDLQLALVRELLTNGR